MAEIIIRDSFLQIYKATTDYGYLNFGRLCAERFDDSLKRIMNRLTTHPLSSPREPLLKKFHRPYRSAIIMQNWKIIYRYDETNDRVIFVDLWDMRMHPKTIVRHFKRKL